MYWPFRNCERYHAIVETGTRSSERLQFDLPGGVDGLWEEEPEEDVESFYPRICLGATVIPSL